MKRRISLLLLVIGLSAYNALEAQVFIGGGFGGGYGYGRPPRPRARVKRPNPELPKFEPTVNISVGYGFPNVDKNQLPVIYGYYPGSVSQNGPITGSIDYQFSPYMSIGALVTHGNVSMPYYNSPTTNVPALTGKLDNWSFMLNLVRYMPVLGGKVSPYIRTAIGINSWQQNYTDAAEAKVNLGTQPGDLAYQVGLGAKFNVSKRAGFFVEAGYGKYIVNGGLAVKF